MFAGLFIPIVIVGLAIAVLGIVVTFTRNYRKCAPNQVLVVYGRKRRVDVMQPDGSTKPVVRGYRLVIGGATFVMPMLESAKEIGLSTFQVQVSVADTPNTDGVSVSVEAVANMKISSDPGLLAAAVERLISMKPQELHTLCTSTMEGQLRQIVGTLTVEEMIKSRETISQKVLEVAKGELNKLGFDLDNFVITKITDKTGYIEALGMKRTAEVKRDAEIAKAEATREQDVKTAEAKLIGEKAKAESEKSISDAQRDKDMAIADNSAKVKSRQARIEIEARTAGESARADLEKTTIAAEVAKVTADTQLQKLEQVRNEARLDATTVTTARKEREARIILAEADQAAALLEGEALRIRSEKEGLGTQAKLTGEAEGRKAAAAALQSEKTAEAAGKQAMLLAEAAGVEANGKAEGAAKLAVFLAEAEGLDKKNKALAGLSDGARFIMVLEKLPGIIEEAGEAGEKIVGSAFEHVGAGLARIDEVRILDMGGSGNGNGTSPVAGFALNIPKIVAGTLAQFEELGINVNGIFEKIGVDSNQFKGILGKAIATSVTKDSEAAVDTE